MMKTSVLVIAACLVGVYNSCSAASINEEIYNGQQAALGQFPFDVFVEVYDMEGGLSLCTGSLISNSWVMTAGHCCEGTNYTVISAGFIDRENRTGAQTFVSPMANIHTHPQFTADPLTYDICVIKLPIPATTTNNVGILNLPPKSDAAANAYAGKTATSSGWGRTYNTQNGGSEFLMFKDVKVMKASTCKRSFSDLSVRQICTDKSTGGGPCPGDSGGPLILNGSDRKPKAIGVVSYGTLCDSKDPVVYTKVTSYLNWINKVTGIAVK